MNRSQKEDALSPVGEEITRVTSEERLDKPRPGTSTSGTSENPKPGTSTTGTSENPRPGTSTGSTSENPKPGLQNGKNPKK